MSPSELRLATQLSVISTNHSSTAAPLSLTLTADWL